jgi:DNA-binding transcriptional LysR family regulator
MSAPAASTRIKNIEESLGVKLLHRSSQGVTLTPPGQALVHHARLVLGQLEHLRTTCRSTRAASVAISACTPTPRPWASSCRPCCALSCWPTPM